MADITTHSTLPTGLKAFWEMEEASGTRTDSKGSNNLTDNNTVTTGTGKMGTYSAKFTRANSESLSIADNADTSPTGDMSFAFWIKFTTFPSTSGQYWGIFGKDGSSTQRSFGLIFQGGGTFNWLLGISSNGSSLPFATINKTVSVGTWYHCAVVYDASAGGWELFIDGVSAGTATGLPTSIHNGTAATYLGRFGNYSGDYGDIELDDVGFWHKTLTSAEVTDLYNSGDGLPYYDPATVVTPNTQSIATSAVSPTVTAIQNVTVAIGTQAIASSSVSPTVSGGAIIASTAQVIAVSAISPVVDAGGNTTIAIGTQTVSAVAVSPTVAVEATITVAVSTQSIVSSVISPTITANENTVLVMNTQTMQLSTVERTLEGSIWGKVGWEDTVDDWTEVARTT